MNILGATLLLVVSASKIAPPPEFLVCQLDHVHFHHKYDTSSDNEDTDCTKDSYYRNDDQAVFHFFVFRQGGDWQGWNECLPIIISAANRIQDFKYEGTSLFHEERKNPLFYSMNVAPSEITIHAVSVDNEHGERTTTDDYINRIDGTFHRRYHNDRAPGGRWDGTLEIEDSTGTCEVRVVKLKALPAAKF